MLRLVVNSVIAFLIAQVVAAADPKDALINPRGQKVCLQQCGTSELKCPEAFWKEHSNSCYRCCSTWGETIIKVQCDEPRKNVTRSAVTATQPKETESMRKQEPERELGFS